MALRKKGRSRFGGYRTPFSDEVCSERAYVKHLNTLKSDKAEFLPIGRQLKVFAREKLDLLAIDRTGLPCVFEFKRDLAGYESVSQLLTYGSYVAGWNLSELRGRYNSVDGRRDLDRAFQARFHTPLPAELPHQVNLVLAAFEFSLPCRRAIHFLEQSAGLTIGRLKIQTIWDWDIPIPRTEYRWFQRPVPTRALKVGSEQKDPRCYYFLQEYFNEFTLHWPSCVNNSFIPVPKEWDIMENPIQPPAGIFVHLAGMPTNFDNELDCGLVGYGITNGHAFNLLERLNEYEMSDEDLDRLPQNEFYVLPVDWVQTRPDYDPAPVSIYLPPAMHLSPIFDHLYINSYKEDLATETYDPFTEPPPEAAPPETDDQGMLG
jgi:hypothetical protein